MADQIVRTGNLWLAAFWMAHGLSFLEANCAEDPNPGHVIFSFADPMGCEPKLSAAFFDDEQLKRVLQCRAYIGHAMHRALDSSGRRCSAAELEQRLAALRRRLRASSD